MSLRRPRIAALALCAIACLGLAPAVALAASTSGPPGGGVEGPHGAVPGFPVNSCAVCHEIAYAEIGASSNWEAVKVPNEVCLGCHTDGPTFGTGDPLYEQRPNATAAENHASLITGSTRFTYGDFGALWWDDDHIRGLQCSSCHDPHRTFDGAGSSTNNVKYIRDHTDDWRVEGGSRGFLRWRNFQDIKVIDDTGPAPVEILKQVDQDVVYTGVGDLADGIGLGAAETNVCEVCHTLTNHHQVDDTAPGGQSHFDGENCTSCHTHISGFAPSGGEPLTGPHAVFGDPDCSSCHDSTYFPGGADNPDGLASVFCATCHAPDTVASIHSHTVTGSTRFEYTMECLSCHDQHGWDITNVDGTDNLAYVKATINEQITVVDNTAGGVSIDKTIHNDVVFDSRDDFANGDGDYTRDICNTCHSLTNHHQNDGTAPGGQSHFDGEDCTTCHTHPEGFRPAGGFKHLDGPHLTVTGGDCNVCHGIVGGFEQALDNPDLVCMACHGASPTVVDAIDAHTHGDSVTGTIKFGYANNCTNCHEPHEQQQAGGNYVRSVIEDLVWNPATFSGDPVPLTLTVVDKTGQSGEVPTTITKDIQSPVVYDGPGSLGTGGGGSLCETCHSLTDHHQNDGTAPGGQNHFNGEDCTQCHLHVEGFAPDGATFGLEGPHAAMPIAGVPPNNCGVCHNLVPGGVVGALANPNTICLACHGETPTLFDATDAHTHSTTVTGSSRFDYENNCTNCHNPHKQAQPGGNYVRSRIEDLTLDPVLGAVPVTLELTVTDHTGQSSPPTFTKQILADILYDGATSLGDGSGDGMCEACHTVTNHHQNDGTAPGGQDHFNGTACTSCHQHVEGFTPSGLEDHVQAQTNCSNCHLNPGTGETDLLALHDNNCETCHPTGYDSTILGPLGTFAGECSECHNPNISETGNMDVPTRGHRCVVCHGEQRSTTDINDFHEEHISEANCVTCHGFIPDVGTEIGSGNRDICILCHGSPRSGTSIREIHEEHVERGLSCLECHGGERPPVDVVFGAPVGNARVVCEICHSYENEDPQEIHEEHVDMRMDCGSCHIDANLQDDRVPMPPKDDARRAEINRSGYNECNFCHGSKGGSARSVHNRHVADQDQWCFNCHLPTDGRPTGDSPPVMEPAQACLLCHSNRTYDDSFPFNVHERHARRRAAKCYTCHQTQPPLFDWPNEWLGGGDSSGGGGGDAVTVRDEFNSTSFSNNDGPDDWAGPWLEDDPQSGGSGPTAGQVRVVTGALRLDDRPNTGGQPSAARTVDLDGLSHAELSFDFSTSSGVDSSDEVVMEVSQNGGGSYTVLEAFTGIQGSTSGSRSYDISGFISAQTTVRFRVTRSYGGSSEYFYADNVQISAD